MSETKIINVAFGKSRGATASARYRYDYGQVIEVVGIYLPETFEARFSNSPHGESIRVIGTQNRVSVPDELFLSGQPIHCYITVHDEVTDGRTMYSIKIPVRDATERTDADPTPVEQDVITQAIASLNNAIDKTNENVEITNTNVELAKESATNESANSARESAESASNSATNAEESATRASESEAHIGQISVEVEQFAQRAETASDNAESSASVSVQKATDASNSADTAIAKASEASGFATNAQNSANSAQQSADNAQQSASSAQESANSASASASKALINAEKTQSDKEIVESVKVDVVNTVGEAQNYADTAQSASQAIQNMGVEAVTLEPNSDATVEKSVDPETGSVTLTYGIPKGIQGIRGEQGIQGIQGEKGDKGDAFKYSDFTPEQLASLKGEKGNKGDPFVYSDFTPEQLASLKGAKGEKGDKGEKGEKGDSYVLTEQDKEDIANMVNAPVTDVQIDGTSVVDNGVANIASTVKELREYSQLGEDTGLIVIPLPEKYEKIWFRFRCRINNSENTLPNSGTAQILAWLGDNSEFKENCDTSITETAQITTSTAFMIRGWYVFDFPYLDRFSVGGQRSDTNYSTFSIKQHGARLNVRKFTSYPKFLYIRPLNTESGYLFKANSSLAVYAK